MMTVPFRNFENLVLNRKAKIINRAFDTCYEITADISVDNYEEMREQICLLQRILDIQQDVLKFQAKLSGCEMNVKSFEKAAVAETP